MEWFNMLKNIWKPTLNFVRTRYHADKTRLVRRYGYEEKIWCGGLLPRAPGKVRTLPEYKAKSAWTERAALFGQNDYIDILGSGDVHPVKTLYHVPSWIRGVAGNEYEIILRRINTMNSTGMYKARPTKWKHLEKRRRFLYKRYNWKTKTGPSKD